MPEGESGAPQAGTTADGGVDAVTLAVVRNAAVAVAEEMNATLIRTSYSPNIKERKDCSCALFDATSTAGDPRPELVSQAENMPVHLGAMPFSVRAAVAAHPPETLAPGDAIVLNDPFRGGAHLPDLTLVTPVFDDGEPVAYAANRAHHADVGGSTAGSVAADTTSIYEEGLRIPPVKLVTDGEIRPDLLETICANVRTPEERRGDLRAQVAANETGRERVRELLADHGDDLRPALAAVKDYSERRTREAIRELPDGTATFADAIDDDGRGNGPLPVEAAVTVDGDEIVVDFAGTAPQTEGPINAVRAVTASATYYAVRCVTDPEIPPNDGCYRPVTVDTPGGSIVDADLPAAVVGGNLETSQRVTDVVLGAFAELVPDRVVAACQGTMNNVTFGGVDPRASDGATAANAGAAAGASDTSGPESNPGGEAIDEPGTADQGEGEPAGSPYAFYETQAGGFGGRASGDGMDAVHVHMSNTLNTPVEVLETAYPLRVERYALRPDSGGAGEHRGGLGLRRDVRVRGHEATVSLLAERHDSRPYGLAGGDPGAPGAAYRLDGEEPERLPAKCTRQLPPGAVVSIRTPGGGGHGDPADRDPAVVARDLRLGKLTPGAARERYGVDPEALLEADPAEIADRTGDR